MRHVNRALFVTTCCLGLACGSPPAGDGKQAPAAKTEAKVETPVTAPEAKPAPAAPQAKRRGRVDGPVGKAVQLEKAPEAVRKAFWEAIQAGRKQTAKKDYTAAIASFDAALQQLPDHPRALSGRGYARLLAGQLDAAEADLRKALAAPGTKKLESAIAFNLGLVAEKRGDAELAKAQFSLANTLNPSKAAQDKLAGGSACPITVEYGKPEGVLHASWKDAWKALADQDLFDPNEPPADEAAAQKLLCTSEPLVDGQGPDTFDACAKNPGGPWLTRRFFGFGATALIVIEPADAGQLRVHDLGWAGGGRCGAETQASLVPGDVSLVLWRVNEYAPIDVMENDKGEIVDCEGDADCFTACGEEVDGYFSVHAFSPWTADPTHIHGPLTSDYKPIAEVKADGRELVISGGGCDRRLPVVNPGG